MKKFSVLHENGDCPVYHQIKPKGTPVRILINITNTPCVLCRLESYSELHYIMVLRDGKLNYFNSSYRGYVSISQDGFTANMNKWLEGEYQILTDLERKCVARVVLVMTNSTLSPLPLNNITQTLKGSWNETDGTKSMALVEQSNWIIIVVVVVVGAPLLTLLLYKLYKHKGIWCARKKPEIQASEDEML